MEILFTRERCISTTLHCVQVHNTIKNGDVWCECIPLIKY